jgi:hypothetical protein
MLQIQPKYKVDFISQGGHMYIINGVKYPSVTSILGIIGGDKTQALMQWSKKISVEYISNELKDLLGKDIIIDETFIDNISRVGMTKPKFELEKAADFGTKCHNAIDDFIISGKHPTDPTVAPVFEAFLNWLKEHKFNIVNGDMVVGSKKYGFGGRMDALAIDDQGNYIVLDWKTSNYFSKEYAMQVSAYAHAFAEQYGVPLPKKCFVVKFHKTEAVYEIKEIDNVAECMEAFVAAKKLREILAKEVYKAGEIEI